MSLRIDVTKFKEFANENKKLPIDVLADILLKGKHEFDFVETDDKSSVSVKEVIEYLNKQTGKKFRHTTNKTRTLIKARAKEGFSIDDFKAAIDNQCKAWDGEMRQYLRPETLFGTKMDSYVNNVPEDANEMSDDEMINSVWSN